jgi:hypothetical protein
MWVLRQSSLLLVVHPNNLLPMLILRQSRLLCLLHQKYLFPLMWIPRHKKLQHFPQYLVKSLFVDGHMMNGDMMYQIWNHYILH